MCGGVQGWGSYQIHGLEKPFGVNHRGYAMYICYDCSWVDTRSASVLESALRGYISEIGTAVDMLVIYHDY